MSKVTTAFILGASAILWGIFNYATYPILIHHLSISDYAEFSTYVSLLAILSIPTAGFAYYILILFRRSFTEIREHETLYIGKIKKYTVLYMLAAALVSLIVFFVLWLKSPQALILMLASLIPGVIAAFYIGMFQALEMFLFMWLLAMMASVLRFFLSFSVLWQSTVWMALVPFVLPAILLSVIYAWCGHRELQSSRVHPIQHTKKEDEIDQSVWHYVTITGVIILLQSIDVLMVKALFSDYDVTLYASVAVISKFALVLIAVIEAVTTPTLVDRHKRTHHKQYILVLGGLSLLGYLVAATFLPWAGNIVLHILKGELSASWTLWTALGISMVSLGFFSLFSKVYMSWGGKILTIVGVCSASIFVGFLAPSLEIFALIFAIILTMLYVITLIQVWKYAERGE